MSFEGYYPILCERGCYNERACYDRHDDETCGFCGAKQVWEHLVSTTNEGDEVRERRRLLGWDFPKLEDPEVGKRYLWPL